MFPAGRRWGVWLSQRWPKASMVFGCLSLMLNWLQEAVRSWRGLAAATARNDNFVAHDLYQSFSARECEVSRLFCSALFCCGLWLTHSVAVAYSCVWALSALWGRVHGPHCRLATVAVVSAATAVLVSPRCGALACGVLLLCPTSFLWWPPKKGSCVMKRRPAARGTPSNAALAAGCYRFGLESWR